MRIGNGESARYAVKRLVITVRRGHKFVNDASALEFFRHPLAHGSMVLTSLTTAMRCHPKGRRDHRHGQHGFPHANASKGTLAGPFDRPVTLTTSRMSDSSPSSCLQKGFRLASIAKAWGHSPDMAHSRYPVPWLSANVRDGLRTCFRMLRKPLEPPALLAQQAAQVKSPTVSSD